jgi:polysaccharide export outer membrane protein
MRQLLARFALVGAAVMTLAVLSGCGTTGSAPVLPESAMPSAETDYIIAPGAVLNVFVWQHEDLSTTVPVRPDGKISTPLIEDMTAAGKTPTQLARDMEEVLAKYIRQPTVNIIMQTAAPSFQQQVRVVGQAASGAPDAGDVRYRYAEVLAATGDAAGAVREARAVLANTGAANYHEAAQKLLDRLERGGE